MIDPPRLLDGSAGDLERELLASALRDAGSEQAFRRVQIAIGAGVASGIAAETASAAAAATAVKTAAAAPLLIAKWAALGMLAGTVATGAAVVVSSPLRAPSVVSTPAEKPGAGHDSRTIQPPGAVFPAVPAQPPPQSPAESNGEPASAARISPSAHGAARPAAVRVTESAPSEQSDAPAVAALPAEAPAAAPSAAAPARMLAQEVALVDAVRAALARRDATSALVGIARHDVAFRGGALALDVAVLRVRALLMAGRTQEATREAERVIAANPTGPYSARVRQILSGANP